MKPDSSEISSYYTRGNLLCRLKAALAQDGMDAENPTAEALAPYDQFHGRGLEATLDIARFIAARATDHILDIGSGIGGPARYFASRFGCKVSAIDLTPEFCDVARHLTRVLGLDNRVTFETGDALAMPFADASFDGAYSMNVSMNIADKSGLYREIQRVLNPGAWLVLSEIAKGTGGEVDYPTPWAASASTSFLATPEETRAFLLTAGIEVISLRSSADDARAFAERSRSMVERGEKPPHRAVMLIHGENAAEAMSNTSRALSQGSIVPIEVLGRKRG